MRDPGPPRGVVYTSSVGRTCPRCSRPVASCTCDRAAVTRAPARTDTFVRLALDRRDRRGKTVTVIEGVPLAAAELATLAADLKRQCGAGGSVGGARIEIQGDHRDRVEAELVRRGFRVKRSGG